MEVRGTVLLVDDEPAIGAVLSALLRQAGMRAEHVLGGEDALQRLAREDIDVVITDQLMPGMDGLALLARIRERWPHVPVIMLTAHGTVQLAVEAMKTGAYDFALKPFDREEILFTVGKALATARHRAAQPPTCGRSALLGRSPAMEEVHRMIAKAAAGRATVLLRGESGTGKGLAARAIHEQSTRKDGPFIQVHCGALPDALLESELFGYEKGAFTGAIAPKPGRVELAEGGTLFLDEIGDVTPAFQVKLLRLLQERVYERLGDTRTHTADIRFVAATHRDLEAMTRQGTFREDLFYRLNVIPIVMPPLRERPGEIPELARQFCENHARANDRPGVTLEEDAIGLLARQPWPGNVRHLENFVERLVVLSDEPRITAELVGRELLRQGDVVERAEDASLDERRRSAERAALVDALQRAAGNRSAAARILGISRRTLYNKLHEHGLL